MAIGVLEWKEPVIEWPLQEIQRQPLEVNERKTGPSKRKRNRWRNDNFSDHPLKQIQFEEEEEEGYHLQPNPFQLWLLHELDLKQETIPGTVKTPLGPERLTKNDRIMIKKCKFDIETVSNWERYILEFINNSTNRQSLHLDHLSGMCRYLIHLLCRYHGIQSRSYESKTGKSISITFTMDSPEERSYFLFSEFLLKK
jgi:hypothetical protein